MALITNKDNFGQTKRHLVINRELKHDVKTAIPIDRFLLDQKPPSLSSGEKLFKMVSIFSNGIGL